jgi:hypothetical protein
MQHLRGSSVALESYVLLLSWEPTPAQVAAALGALYATANLLAPRTAEASAAPISSLPN